MKLFHATKEQNKDLILKYGLIVSNGKNTNYCGSDTDGCIFLATEYDIAYSMVECADTYNDETIVVFEIDTKNIDMSSIYIDRNILFDNDDIYSYEYHKNIPEKFLKLCVDND